MPRLPRARSGAFKRRKFSGVRKNRSVKALDRRISRVARESKRVDYVCDDFLNDYNYLPYTQAVDVDHAWSYKYWGLPWSTAATTASLLNAGLQEGDVRGSKIFMKSITVRGVIGMQSAIPATDDATNVVRIIALWDSDAASYSAGSVANNFPSVYTHPVAYFNGAATNPTIASVFGGFNPVYVGKGKRYSKVLFDKTYCLSRTGNQLLQFRAKIKIHKWAGMANTSGNGCLSQNVIFGFCSDSGLAPNPYIAFAARLCYNT